jgi:hypothetical protein
MTDWVRLRSNMEEENDILRQELIRPIENYIEKLRIKERNWIKNLLCCRYTGPV